MLEIRKLSCGYGEHPIISQLDLSVPEGSLTVIVGPNGCGKSTLLKAITGMLPFSGSVVLHLGLFGPSQMNGSLFLQAAEAPEELIYGFTLLDGKFVHDIAPFCLQGLITKVNQSGWTFWTWRGLATHYPGEQRRSWGRRPRERV